MPVGRDEESIIDFQGGNFLSQSFLDLLLLKESGRAASDRQ